MGREKKKSVGKHSDAAEDKKVNTNRKTTSTRKKSETSKNETTSTRRRAETSKKEIEDIENSTLSEDTINTKNSSNTDEIDDLFDQKIIGMNYGGEEENKKSQKKKKMSKPLKIILTILIVILVVVGSVFGSYIFKSGGNVTEAIKTMVKDVVGDQDPIFILVLGVSEDISAELTDTIMLVGYNPDNNQAFVLSIPRDTFIGNNENTAGGFDKINALYQKDPAKTVAAVEKLTGIKIDHYVTVKTSILVKIVDTLGGVDFDVPINMDYDDPSQDLHIHLKAGQQKLDGEHAEQLVRFRHNNNGSTYSPAYGDNDEGRMRTQREFLKVVVNQVIKTRNVDQIKQIANSIFENLVTNITLNKAIGYVPYAMDIKLDEIQMDQLPGGFEKLNSLWFYKANTSKTESLIDSYIEKLGLTEAEKKKYLLPKTNNNTVIKATNKNNTSSNTNTSKSNNTNTEKNTTENTTTKNTANTTNTTEKNNTTNTSGKNTTKKENTTENNTTTNNTNTNTNSSGNSTGESSSSNNGNKNETSTTENKTTENTTKPSEGGNDSGSGKSEGSGTSSGSDESSGSGDQT